MRARLAGSIVVTVTIASLVAAGGAAAPGTAAGERAEHQRVIAYWSAERIASAVPADMVRQGPPGHAAKRPDQPPGRNPDTGPGNGNGNGRGGGKGPGVPDDGTVVEGEVWTGGGEVRDTTGKVLFTVGTTNYLCSASLVDDTLATHSLVITAGHCVYDRQAGWATNWVFFPDFESDPRLTSPCTDTRCYVADRLVTTQEWSEGNFTHDYGFAVLAPNGAGLAEARGTQAIAFDLPRGEWVDAFGYSHAAPYDGTKLVWCAGQAVDDPYGSTTQGLTCNMAGGSSGGPWISSFDSATGAGVVTSVNSYRYSNDSMTMYGPSLDAGAALTYHEANRPVTGNMLVGASAGS